MRHATLLVFALATSAAHAQDYLSNAPGWSVHSMCGVPAPCIANDDYHYYTAGDSVINGTTWTKVLREGSYTLNWQSPNFPDPDCQGQQSYGPAYHGVKFIRQEARQLRIWADDADQLLHEFDLVVGQTLPASYTNFVPDITVLAVDSVLIGTEMRARYELANSWAQYLIEGVGSSHGLFEPLSNFFDCGYGLDCFGLGSVSYYPSTSCTLMMGERPAPALDQFTISPNPADATITLSGSLPGSLIAVHDVLGRPVMGRRFTPGTTSVDVSILPDGWYTLVCGDQVSRFVVRH